MDFLFPRDDRERLQFKESALQIGFEELTAECTASISLLQPHDRLSVLMMAWKKIGDYLTHNQYTPSVGNVVNWVGRHTLELWFGRDWISCPAENKTTLIEYMMKVYPTAYIAMCPYSWPYMFSIYRDPWMVDYLNINFQRMNDPELSDYLDAKDSDFILQEGMSLIFLRIVNMFDFNMMKLVKHMCRRLLLAWHDRFSSAHRSLRAAINATECIEYVRHMYLITFYETSGMKDLHYVLECVQRNLHCNTTEYSHLDRAAQIIAEGLLECKQTLMEFLITFLSKVPERQFSNTFGNSVDKYKSFLTEYLLRKIHNRKTVGCAGLLPADGIYENLIKMFIKKRESSDDLMKNTPAVSERLFAELHDLKALKFSYDKIKSLTRVEWYTTKITLLLGIISKELNNLEDCKYTEGQTADELIKKEQDLAIYYRDLSRLLGRTPVLEQEAWLTTFSLYPCREYLDAVTKCGSRNLRAIKKQAIKLKVISEPKPSKPTDNCEENNSSFNKETQSQNLTEELSAVPEKEEIPCTSLASSEGNSSIKEGETPTGRKTVPGKPKRQLPTKAIKPINRPRPKSKLIKKSVQVVRKPTTATPIPKKPLIDCKDKNTAEVLFAASAGAGDNVSHLTEETIKYPGFALINSVTDTEEVIRYTDYDGDVLAQYRELTRILSNIRLQCSNYDDLLALLVAPRYKRLTWATCWKNLRKRCRFLLTKDTRKKQLVEQYLADANERLTHLQIDYEKYKNKPQIDYGSIEDGYECFETEPVEERGLRAVLHNLKRSGKIKRINIKPASADELDEPDRSEEDDLSETESLQSTTRIDEEQLLQKFELLVDADQTRTTSSGSPQDETAYALESERIQSDQEAPTNQAAKALAHIKTNLNVQGPQRNHGSSSFKKNPSVLVHRLQVSSTGQFLSSIQTASIPSVQVPRRDKELQSIQVTASYSTEPTIHKDQISAASLQEFPSDQVSPSDQKAPAVHLGPSHVESVPIAQVIPAVESTPATPASETDTTLILEAEPLRVLIPKVPLRTYSRQRTVPSKKLLKLTTGIEVSESKRHRESTSIAEFTSIESSESSEKLILSTATADTNATKKVSILADNVNKLGEKNPLSDPLTLTPNLESASTESLSLKETTNTSQLEEENNSTEMSREWRPPYPTFEEDPGWYDHSTDPYGRANPIMEQPEYQSPHLLGSRFARDLNYAAQQLSAELLNHAQQISSYFRPPENTGNRDVVRSTPQMPPIYVPNLIRHHTYGPYPRPHYHDHYHDPNAPPCPVVIALPNPGLNASTFIDYQGTNPAPLSCVTITTLGHPCEHGHGRPCCHHAIPQPQLQPQPQPQPQSQPPPEEGDGDDEEGEEEEEIEDEDEEDEEGDDSPSPERSDAQNDKKQNKDEGDVGNNRAIKVERSDRDDNEYISFTGTEDANIFLRRNAQQTDNAPQSTDLPAAQTIPHSHSCPNYADAQGTIPRLAYQTQAGSSGQTISHVPSVNSHVIPNRNTQTDSGEAFAHLLNQVPEQTSHLTATGQLDVSRFLRDLNPAISQTSQSTAAAQLNMARFLDEMNHQARSQTSQCKFPLGQTNPPRTQTSQSTAAAQLNMSRFLDEMNHQARSQTSQCKFALGQMNQARLQASQSTATGQFNLPQFPEETNQARSQTSQCKFSLGQMNQARLQTSQSTATGQLNVSQFPEETSQTRSQTSQCKFALGQMNQARLQTSQSTATGQLNVSQFPEETNQERSQTSQCKFALGQMNQARLQTSQSTATGQLQMSRLPALNRGQISQAQPLTFQTTAAGQLNVPRITALNHGQISQARPLTAQLTAAAQLDLSRFALGLMNHARSRTSQSAAAAQLNMPRYSHAQMNQAQTQTSQSTAIEQRNEPETGSAQASFNQAQAQACQSTSNYDITTQSCPKDIPISMIIPDAQEIYQHCVQSADPIETIDLRDIVDTSDIVDLSGSIDLRELLDQRETDLRENMQPRDTMQPTATVDPIPIQTVELNDSDTESEKDVPQYQATHTPQRAAETDIEAPSCSRDIPPSVALPGPSGYVPSAEGNARSTNFYRSTQSEPGTAQPSHSRADAELADDINAQSCSSGLKSSSGLRPVPQTHVDPFADTEDYTYFPPELNTVQIVKPSGTTRINKMTVELGQGMRNIIPNDREDVLQLRAPNQFPNPRWRPFFSSMLKRKLIFVPTEAEAEEILSEYSSQRRNGKWTTQIVTFGLGEDNPGEEITDETVLINLTNPPYTEEPHVDTEEWSTRRTGQINHSRPEIEGEEAGVRYNLDPPIHFFLGIPSPAYSFSIVCPFGVQGSNAPSEILTVDPEFSYKIYMFLREDDFAWDLLSLTPTQAPSNHDSDDDDDDNQLDFQQAPQGDVEVVNISNGVRTQDGENMDVNRAEDNGANDGDNGDEGEPPEGGEDEAREPDNNDDQGEDDEEESDHRTDGEQGSEVDDEEENDPTEDDEVDDDREVENEENIPEPGGSNIPPAISEIHPSILPQRCHNLSDSDSDTDDSDASMKNVNQSEQFLQQPQMQEFENTMQEQDEQDASAPACEIQNAGDSVNNPGNSGTNAQPEMERIPGTSTAMDDQNPHSYRTANKRILEDSDSDSEILVRRSGRYALKVYGAGSRTRVMEGRPGPSTSGRQSMPTNNPIPEPDIICLSSSSSSDDDACDRA